MKKFIFTFILLITFFATPSFASWSPWISLEGQTVGDPAAVTCKSQTFVVARGTDNAIWFRTRIGASDWVSWRRIPGTRQFSGSPSARCYTNGNTGYLEVYAVTLDGQLYFNVQNLDGTFPSTWKRQHLNGIARLALAKNSGLSTPSERLGNSLFPRFARGQNQKLYSLTCRGVRDCPDPWKQISNVVIASDPAVFRIQGYLELVVQGIDGNLYQMSQHLLDPWTSLTMIHNSAVTSAPDLVGLSVFTLKLFARGPNNTLLVKTRFNFQWSDWEDLGGYLTSGPAATIYSNDKNIFVVARGTDNGLWYRTWEP